MLSEYLQFRWQFLSLRTAMKVFCDLSGERLTGYALIAAAASFALTPWIWLFLVW
jgi:hypothetical protein